MNLPDKGQPEDDRCECGLPKSTMRLIKPWAHRLSIDHSDKPVYADCTGETCRICHKGEVAKNLQAIDDLVRRLTA